MNNSDTPLTHDEHRELAEEMLDGTKDLNTYTVKVIGEGIENQTTHLETILLTLFWLSTLGESYFKGHFADRGRYESLVCPFWIFTQMIVKKLKELDLTLVADLLYENKEKVIQFLKDSNWTTADMTSQW